MKDCSLSKIFSSIHSSIQNELEISYKNMNYHPVVKGDSTEKAWLKIFQNYLPERYQATRAHVVDSKNNFSEQIDIVIFDRQYSPILFKFNEVTILPAESVYAVFEVKQKVDSDAISYAQKKIESVRKLFRTSLPIPHAGGEYEPKDPPYISGGILAFESDWQTPLGKSLEKSLNKRKDVGVLDLGCILSHGYFSYNQKKKKYEIFNKKESATLFLFYFISQLQLKATVSMIDIKTYSKWLCKK